VARPREIPSDRRWLAAYLDRQGLSLTPETAAETLDAEAWTRLQAAWRAHKAKLAGSKRTLTPESWLRLELIARRIGRPGDLDAAIARLADVPELGALIRDAQTRNRSAW